MNYVHLSTSLPFWWLDWDDLSLELDICGILSIVGFDDFFEYWTEPLFNFHSKQYKKGSNIPNTELVF
jgi:hypothetical protein